MQYLFVIKEEIKKNNVSSKYVNNICCVQVDETSLQFKLTFQCEKSCL